MMFTELSLGYWSSGIEIYTCIHFRLPQCFSLSVTCTYMSPLQRILLEVVCCFSRNELFTLNMAMFVGSQSFISLPSFMFVSAAVNQIRKLNQNKEEEENSISNLRK